MLSIEAIPFTILDICHEWIKSHILWHRGRTDQDGGHRDLNNQAGLGEYHFHHGFPPHRHQPECPYGEERRASLIELLIKCGAQLSTKNIGTSESPKYLFEGIIELYRNNLWLSIQFGATNQYEDGFYIFGYIPKLLVEKFFDTPLNPHPINVDDGPWLGTTGHIDFLVNESYFYKFIERYIGATHPDDFSMADLQSHKEFIWNYLTNNEGLSDIHTAAIMGNFMIESYLSPLCLQGVNTEANRHSPAYVYEYNTHDGKGWGLAQWTYWSRKQGLLDLANSERTSVGDMVTQLKYLFYELYHSNEYAKEYLNFLAIENSIENLDEATTFFCEKIERAGIPHLSWRKEKAHLFFNEFSK